MISSLCGFANLLRRNGAEVGSAELIDAARALVLTDLADRASVRRAITVTMNWATLNPAQFDRLFDVWYSCADLDLAAITGATAEAPKELASVELDADTTDAARIHADDGIVLDERESGGSSAPASTTVVDAPPAQGPAPSTPCLDDGQSAGASGDLAPVPPSEDDAGHVQAMVSLVDLPDTPLPEELELARATLADAVERRRHVTTAAAPRRVTAVTEPLLAEERSHLRRCVQRLDRELDGAPAWRRTRRHDGAIDLRRTMRRTVMTGGRPIDLRHAGKRDSAARLVVLVDLSMSVRGTARLVLHLVHRMRSSLGSLRAFGFVDSCVSIDRELRHAKAAMAIEHILGAVDLNASSDPGGALREWSMRWSHLVAPSTHIIILSDGRCNGRDPEFEVVERIRRRSASTIWVSPEPAGAWQLGRGEMDEYARRVDRAITIRSIDDLDLLTPQSARRPARQEQRIDVLISGGSGVKP